MSYNISFIMTLSILYFTIYIEPEVVAHVQVKEELSALIKNELILKVEESIKGNTAIKEVSVSLCNLWPTGI